MNVQQLGNILQHTFNPDARLRHQAEEQLKAFATQAGFTTALLQLTTLNEAPLEIRQAAVIQLKNQVECHWSSRHQERFILSEADKKMFKDNIIEAIVWQQENRIRNQLMAAFLHAVKKDYERWPTLMPEIMRNFSDSNETRIHGGLTALSQVVRAFRYLSSKVRVEMQNIAQASFGRLLEIGALCLRTPSENAHRLLHTVVKTFYMGVQMSIPPCLQQPQVWSQWMEFIIAVIQAPIPEAYVAQKDTLSDRDKGDFPIMKARKWAFKTLYRTFARFGWPKAVESKEKEFANYYFNGFAQQTLTVLLTCLQQYEQGAMYTGGQLKRIYDYVDTCVGIASLYNACLKENLRWLLLQCVFKTICLSPEDLFEFQHNPSEFALRNLDFDFHDPKIAASNVLISVMKYRPSHSLDLLLDAITVLFDGYARSSEEKKNHIHKEGAMRMFGTMKKLLLSKESFRDPIIQVLTTHVFPECNSRLPYLRSRAMWVIGKYSMLDWQNPEHTAFACRTAGSLLRDEALPVKLEAARCLSRIVRDCDVVEIIIPEIPFILGEYFRLIDDIGSDEVLMTLTTLVNKVGENIAPYAMEMISKLVGIFTQSSQDVEDDDACGAALEAIRAINSIAYCVRKQPNLYPQIEQIVAPMLDLLVNIDGVEYYEDTLELVCVLTLFTNISPFMWSLLPRIVASFHDWAGDYLCNMLASIDNYISNGTEHFVTCQDPNYMQITISIVDTLFKENGREQEAQYACKILEAIFAHAHGAVNGLVAPALALCMHKLQNSKELLLKLQILDVVGVICHYNPALFLQSLPNAEALKFLLNFWLSHLEAMDDAPKHQKKSLLGLASLCLVPLDQMPPVLANGFPAVVQQQLGVLRNILESKNKKENKKNNSDDDESSEEEYDGFDGPEIEHFEELNDDQDVIDRDVGATFGDSLISLVNDESLDDPESFASPLDKIDVFVFVAHCYTHIAQRNQSFWQQFGASLPPVLGQTLQLSMAEAEQRFKKQQDEQQQKQQEQQR